MSDEKSLGASGERKSLELKVKQISQVLEKLMKDVEGERKRLRDESPAKMKSCLEHLKPLWDQLHQAFQSMNS